MPTPHGRVTIITPQETEVAIADLMEATGRHKSAVLKEALHLGLTALKDKHNLTSSKRVSEMTEEQLRAIVREEVAAANQFDPVAFKEAFDKKLRESLKSPSHGGVTF